MNDELVRTIESFLQTIILKYYGNRSLNIFDEFLTFCQNYYEGPVHSLMEMKLRRNTKLKGDIFEHFALKYFQSAYVTEFKNVWLLRDVPEELLTLLKLKRHDLGIDLIAETHKKTYFAIQAKYRKKGYKLTHGIPWQQLSTFYGLINRTGPYSKHIVITNANYVRHIGRKNKFDQSICYGTLRKITLDQWILMANFKGQSLNHSGEDTLQTNQKDEEVKKVLQTHEYSNEDQGSPLKSKKKITIIRKIVKNDIYLRDDILKQTSIKNPSRIDIPKQWDIEAIRAKRLEFFVNKGIQN